MNKKSASDIMIAMDCIDQNDDVVRWYDRYVQNISDEPWPDACLRVFIDTQIKIKLEDYVADAGKYHEHEKEKIAAEVLNRYSGDIMFRLNLQMHLMAILKEERRNFIRAHR